MSEDLNLRAIAAVESSAALNDPDYPRFHVAPPVGRLNDPNGLLIDKDTYHVFYQYSPFFPSKPVFWGHASSTDLVRWTDHGPAIVPDSRYDRHGAYSGNGLILDTEELPAETIAALGGPYVLHYTGNVKDEQTNIREATQCLVTSTDLETFTKHPSNPTILKQPEGYTAHFRDPQVWFEEESQTFRMLLGAQRADASGAALLYRSDDLLEWTCEGELSFPDANGAFDSLGYMWECPSLTRIADEETGELFDVLIWCPQGYEPDVEGYENIFPCTYTVGHLVGTELRECDGSLYEVDRGFEFYAPQVFARRRNTPGAVLLMGWAGNASEDDQPSVETGGWVHTMTVPRELTLRQGRLIQRSAVKIDEPIADVQLSGKKISGGEVEVEALAGSRSWQLQLQVDDSQANSWTLRIGSKESSVSFTLEAGQLVVDRSTSRYPHGDRRVITLPEGASQTLDIIHDRSVTELFLGDGSVALCLRSFVDPASSGLSLQVDGALQIDRATLQTRD